MAIPRGELDFVIFAITRLARWRIANAVLVAQRVLNLRIDLFHRLAFRDLLGHAAGFLRHAVQSLFAAFLGRTPNRGPDRPVQGNWI